jgi:hypothetical protein
MFDNRFSYYEGDSFMSCRMLFVLAEEYALFSYEKKVWELLEIRNDTWSEYKKWRKLPKKHYKKLCWFLGCKETDDDRELCSMILNKYFDDKEVGDA